MARKKVYKKYKKRVYRKTKKDKAQDRKIKKLETMVFNELKTISTIIGQTNMSTTPYVAPLSMVAVGDNVSSREGNVIRAASLVIRYQVHFDNSGAPLNIWDPTIFSNAWMRVIIFRDKQSNGVAPTIFSSTLQDGLLGGGASATRNALLNVNPVILTSGRYKIIHDKTHQFLPNAEASFNGTMNNAISRIVRMKKKIKHNIYFSDTDANQTALLKNHYYIAVWIGETGLTYNPQFQYNSQLRFWDV